MCISILILVVICMIWFQRCKQKKQSQDMHVTNRGKNVPQNKVLEVEDDTVANTFGVYDYIDDSQVLDIVIPDINSVEMADTAYNYSSDSKSDSDETTTSLNDGYLNPYQPVLSSNESHGYTEATDSTVDHLFTFRRKTTAYIQETGNVIIENLSSSFDPSNRDGISSRSHEDGQMSSYLSMQGSSDGQQGNA